MMIGGCCCRDDAALGESAHDGLMKNGYFVGPGQYFVRLRMLLNLRSEAAIDYSITHRELEMRNEDFHHD